MRSEDQEYYDSVVLVGPRHSKEYINELKKLGNILVLGNGVDRLTEEEIEAALTGKVGPKTRFYLWGHGSVAESFLSNDCYHAINLIQGKSKTEEVLRLLKSIYGSENQMEVDVFSCQAHGTPPPGVSVAYHSSKKHITLIEMNFNTIKSGIEFRNDYSESNIYLTLADYVLDSSIDGYVNLANYVPYFQSLYATVAHDVLHFPETVVLAVHYEGKEVKSVKLEAPKQSFYTTFEMHYESLIQKLSGLRKKVGVDNDKFSKDFVSSKDIGDACELYRKRQIEMSIFRGDANALASCLNRYVKPDINEIDKDGNT